MCIRDSLLVEDSPGDVRLTREAFKDAKVLLNMHVASDGTEAMAFLRREQGHADAPRPDLILLDLNLPKKDGREVLEEIKQSPTLKSIPVVILTTSASDADILKSYMLHANCYITKPVDLKGFLNVVTVSYTHLDVYKRQKQFGYHRDELVGQKVKNIIPEGFAERLIADGTRTAAEALAQQIGTGIELIGRRKDCLLYTSRCV